jgi:hypothetical protein
VVNKVGCFLTCKHSSGGGTAKFHTGDRNLLDCRVVEGSK